MSSQCLQEIGKNRLVNGFALILTNDYAELGKLPTLNGTRIDGRKMRKSLELLNFETHWEHNATAAATLNVVSAAARCHYIPNYRRIIFVFSGHGTSNHSLYAQDGKIVNFEEILKAFYPECNPRLGAIPKLFFIDACRGPRSTRPVLVSKGVQDTTLKVPEKSNFVIAYSTMPEHKSHEQVDKGGIWIDILAEKLSTTEASILDILTIVNYNLCLMFQSSTFDVFQQPELISRLNEEVNLLREARPAQVDKKLIEDGINPSAYTDQEDDSSQLLCLPKHSSTKQTLQVFNVCGFSMCTSAKQKVRLYCEMKEKPEPKYQHWLEGTQHRVWVYVARTCGRVTGDPKLAVEDAEESAAEKLLLKLHIH